jgi:hypothetical protein
MLILRFFECLKWFGRMSFRTMKRVENEMSSAKDYLHLRLFTRKLSDNFFRMWQVFWLGVHRILPVPALPKQWLYTIYPARAGPLYSYGDSAGISPDFPFNLFCNNVTGFC